MSTDDGAAADLLSALASAVGLDDQDEDQDPTAVESAHSVSARSLLSEGDTFIVVGNSAEGGDQTQHDDETGGENECQQGLKISLLTFFSVFRRHR